MGVAVLLQEIQTKAAVDKHPQQAAAKSNAEKK
jgi:hypothetical protein